MANIYIGFKKYKTFKDHPLKLILVMTQQVKVKKPA